MAYDEAVELMWDLQTRELTLSFLVRAKAEILTRSMKGRRLTNSQARVLKIAAMEFLEELENMTDAEAPHELR